MKQFINIITTIIITLLSTTGCSGDFLDQSPTDAVPSDKISTPENAIKIFNGTWRYMFDTFFTYANPGYSAVLRQDDMMGNDVIAYPGKYGFSAAYQFKDTPDKTVYRTRAFWTLHYKVIDNCNKILSITSTIPNKEFNRAQGMAYALRAYTYFSLAQHYQYTYLKDPSALCVPVYTTPTTDRTKPKGKSPLKDIYALITEDLEHASALLQNTERTQKFEPNTDVINGLSARIYLVTGEWEKASEMAAKARTGYPLMSSSEYLKGFNDVNNSEWIWGHPQTPEQSNASYSFNYQDVVSPASYYYSFMSDPHFKELFTDPADIRLGLFEWIRDGYLGYKKFLFRNDNTADIVLMRSAEMYLIEAEAKIRDGKTSLSDAVVPLNELRRARGLSYYNTTGKSRDEILQEIILERRRELWGEGFALTDILRLQKPVERQTYTGAPVSCRQIPGNELKEYPPQGHYILQQPDGTPFISNSRFYLFAIPETEENANPEL